MPARYRRAVDRQSRPATTAQVTSYIGNSATLHVANEVDVTATGRVDAERDGSGVLGGIIAAGSDQSTANSSTDATAYIGQDDTVNSNILNLAAEGSDNDYAGTTSGSGGIIAGVVADSATNHDGADPRVRQQRDGHCRQHRADRGCPHRHVQR